MLKNTFCHVKGIGAKREAQLWASGVKTWDALLNNADVPFSKSRMVGITHEIEQSYAQLNEHKPCYFADKLNSSELWRIIPEFYGSMAFLDIETTGLDSIPVNEFL